MVLTDDDAVVPTALAVRPRDGLGGEHRVVALHRFPVLGRSQFPDDRRGRRRARCSSATALPRGVAYLALARARRRRRLVDPRGDERRATCRRGSSPARSRRSRAARTATTSASPTARRNIRAATPRRSRRSPTAAATSASSTPSIAWAVDAGGRPRIRRALRALRLPRSARGLLSPRFGVAVEPFRRRAFARRSAQRMVAPGAEEFLVDQRAGPVAAARADVRAARRPGAIDAFRVERARSFDVGVEHEFGDAFVVGVRPLPPVGRRSAGHAVRPADAGRPALGRPLLRRQRRRGRRRRLGGPAEHAADRARAGLGATTAVTPRALGRSRGDMRLLARPGRRRRSAPTPRSSTTSRRRSTTDIRETATRVFVLYKMNNGFARIRERARPRPASTAASTSRSIRRCRSAFAGTKWEVLVGLRNLFRDPDRSRLGLRRAARRPPAQAGVGGVPGPVLTSASTADSPCNLRAPASGTAGFLNPAAPAVVGTPASAGCRRQ